MTPEETTVQVLILWALAMSTVINLGTVIWNIFSGPSKKNGARLDALAGQLGLVDQRVAKVEQAQQAQLLAENARKGYDAGFLTVLDVIDAQRAYRDSVKDFLQAQVDAQRTRLELFWISAGSLVSEEEKP